MKICKYWFEDDYGTGLKEICKLAIRPVICCGRLNRCEYLDLLERIKNKDIKKD